jgi:hypothetical protein
MAKLSLNYIAILFSSVLIFSSCMNEITVKTKTELITQSSWKFDKAIAVGAGDISSQVPSCLKDNIFIFNSNGTGEVQESTDVCNPTTASTFTWAFQSNETMLQISAALFPGGSGDFTIVTLTETNLVLSQQMTISPLPPTTVEVTFKH